MELSPPIQPVFTASFCYILVDLLKTKTPENYLTSFEKEERQKNASLLTNFEG